MNIFKTIFSVLTCLVCGLRASPQSFTSKGTVELGGDFSFAFQKNSSQKDLSFTTFSFNAFLGVMAVKGFEIGIMPAISGYNYSNYSVSEFGGFLAPSFNFTTKSNVNPYIELLGGYGLIDDGNENATFMGLGGDAGIKAMLGGRSLLLIKVEYLRRFIDYLGENDSHNYIPEDYNLDALTFGVGFRFFIPGGDSKPAN